MIHSAAIRRIRASTFWTASIARIRISTTPANNRVNPPIVKNKGHSIEPSMLELVSPMLCPWCNVFHHTTE